MLFACSVDGGFGDFVKQGVGLAVEYSIALLNRRMSDGLSQMALACTGGPKNKASSCLAMKAAVARSKTRLRFIFLLKLKSKLSSVFWDRGTGLVFFAAPAVVRFAE